MNVHVQFLCENTYIIILIIIAIGIIEPLNIKKEDKRSKNYAHSCAYMSLSICYER